MRGPLHSKKEALFWDLTRLLNFSRTKSSTKTSTGHPEEDHSTVKIDLKAKSRKGKEIANIMNELTVDDGDNEDEEDDLLALMDKAK